MFVLTGIGESPLGTTVGGQYFPKIRGGDGEEGVMRFFGPLSKRLELSKRASEVNDSTLKDQQFELYVFPISSTVNEILWNNNF